ncbi:hypothetical protein NDU88_003148 [Pleurodeles waltl]|uniref:Ig-like domain-containing protein n=1 Tax=Pleurodeles waltl TaxID=8319 RepID=A0AAV7SCM2_PLEWA|nr:hypothetical protein NDU88_003148 [Pleurodeles waltl]
MARLLFSCILLLELALFTGFLGGMGVLQPATLIGLMGSSVTLNCTCQCQGRSVHRSSSRWDVHHNKTTTKELWRGGDGKQTLEAASQEETRYAGHHANYTSSLAIKSLQISDAGTYVCTINTIIPPPIREEKGQGTVLRVVGKCQGPVNLKRPVKYN